jgi:tetratricopeptide (TPR) repeat protein
MSFASALALHEAGEHSGAMQAYRQLLQTEGVGAGKYAAAAYSNLGMLLGSKGRHEECAGASAAAAALSPDNPLIIYNLGNAQMELQRDAEAAATYRRVLALERQHAPSYHNLALLSHRRGSLSEALAFFHSALECGPKQLASLGGAAQVYASMAATGLASGSVLADAVATQREAAAARPDDAQSHVRLAERALEAAAAGAMARSDADAEAESALVRATRLAPTDGHALNLLGTLLQAQPGRWREAAHAYRMALSSSGATSGGAVPDAYHNLGTIYQRLSRHEEARSMYSVALTLAPAVPNIYISLASLSPSPLNVRLLRHAIRLRPGDGDSYARLAAALAPTPLGGAESPPEAALRKAIDALTHATRLQPLNPHLRSELGKARLALGTVVLAESTADFEEALALEPAVFDARNAAALLHKTLGSAEKAAAHFHSSIQLVQRASMITSGDDAARTASSLALDQIDWKTAARSICASGYYVIDRILGNDTAWAIAAQMDRLAPLMQPGRVGAGQSTQSVRTDVLWRHRRGEGTVVDSTLPHMRALHAIFDAIPTGLNSLTRDRRQCSKGTQGREGGRDAGTQSVQMDGACDASAEVACDALGSDGAHAQCDLSWAIVHAEDLQFACYRPGGYYRRHSDAQNASRRVLTAIYYANPKWRTGDGGLLRLYRSDAVTLSGTRGKGAIEIEPRYDRLLLFDSRLDHEVVPMADPASRRKGGKGAPPPRCAATQWFQDLAPPLIRSGLATVLR